MKVRSGLSRGYFRPGLGDLNGAQAFGPTHHRVFDRGVVEMRERIAALGQNPVFQSPGKRAGYFDVEFGNRFHVPGADDRPEVIGDIAASIRRQRIDDRAAALHQRIPGKTQLPDGREVTAVRPKRLAQAICLAQFR
jgi:hypothetical protein